MSIITIFGSGTCKEDSDEYKLAEKLGKLLSDKGFDIATGGYGGIMEAALKGASQNDVKRIGVVTEFYKEMKPNAYVNEVINVETYIDRLSKLVEIGNAYVILPGETGTLLEFSTVWTLKDKKIISDKPIICFGEVWQEVLQTMGFYSEALLEDSLLIENVNNPEDAVSILADKMNK